MITHIYISDLFASFSLSLHLISYLQQICKTLLRGSKRKALGFDQKHLIENIDPTGHWEVYEILTRMKFLGNFHTLNLFHTFLTLLFPLQKCSY